jgi:hypothetical protein
MMMRVSELDRRRAIKRLPEFIKDYDEYEQLKKTIDPIKDESGPKGSVFNGIIFREDKLKKKWGCPVDAINMADKMSKRKKKPSSVRQVTSIDQPPIIKFQIGKDKDIIREQIEGECLYLKVDLSKTMDTLVHDFKALVKSYQDIIKQSAKSKQERQGTTSEDIWEIYDLHTKNGMPLLEIARRLSGNDYPSGERTPAYREELWSPYKRVERAYKKAKEIIQTVSLSFPMKSSVDV